MATSRAQRLEAAHDRAADEVDALEAKLASDGYIRSKDPNGNEYQYKWEKSGHSTHIVNYRFGPYGMQAHWIEGR